jgi:hypothetical protein
MVLVITPLIALVQDQVGADEDAPPDGMPSRRPDSPACAQIANLPTDLVGVTLNSGMSSGEVSVHVYGCVSCAEQGRACRAVLRWTRSATCEGELPLTPPLRRGCGVESQVATAKKQILQGQVHILFISPETLVTSWHVQACAWRRCRGHPRRSTLACGRRFLTLLQHTQTPAIAFACVDEVSAKPLLAALPRPSRVFLYLLPRG